MKLKLFFTATVLGLSFASFANAQSESNVRSLRSKLESAIVKIDGLKSKADNLTGNQGSSSRDIDRGRDRSGGRDERVGEGRRSGDRPGGYCSPLNPRCFDEADMVVSNLLNRASSRLVSASQRLIRAEQEFAWGSFDRGIAFHALTCTKVAGAAGNLARAYGEAILYPQFDSVFVLDDFQSVIDDINDYMLDPTLSCPFTPIYL